MAEKYVVGKITELAVRKEDPTMVAGKAFATVPMNDMHSIYMPTYKWRVDFFGDGRSFCFESNKDSVWLRFWTRFFFGTRWTRNT